MIDIVFEQYKDFIICINNVAILIMLIDEIYYFFDPHRIHTEGYPIADATAILLKFSDVISLKQYLYV